MKNTLSAIVLVLILIALMINQILPADAAKKNVKKKSISQEILTEFSDTVNLLTKKIYERELYTPEDSKSLITLKIYINYYRNILI